MIVPVVKRVVSPAAVATIVSTAGVDVTVVLVGIVVGAVYVMLFEPGTGVLSVPQVGEHVATDGYGIVDVGKVCVISHVIPLLCKSLVRAPTNVCCSPVGTEAVVGVIPTKIPESSTSVAVPVFFVSCADVAVTVTTSPGNAVWSGTFDGAVNVTVA